MFVECGRKQAETHVIKGRTYKEVLTQKQTSFSRFICLDLQYGSNSKYPEEDLLREFVDKQEDMTTSYGQGRRWRTPALPSMRNLTIVPPSL